MSDSVEQAKASFERWNAAFNARDMDGMIAEMHFPHRRLSGENEFQIYGRLLTIFVLLAAKI